MGRADEMAAMAARFLGVDMTGDGFEAFGAAIERLLAEKRGAIDLEVCRALLAANPAWVKHGAMPQLPAFATRMRDATKLMARS